MKNTTMPHQDFQSPINEAPCSPADSIPRWRAALACLGSVALVALAACSHSSSDLPVHSKGTELPRSDQAYATTVQIRYLGAGGTVIKRGDDVLLTAPFFSNPKMLRVAFGEIGVVPEQVNRFLKAGDNDLAAANAILVGHSHYDHLMDIPYIKATFMPNAKIYGSNTMRYILLAQDAHIKSTDIFSVQPVMGDAQKPGQWFYASPRLRFMALKSMHAPIIWGISFFEGDYDAPLTQLPKRASGWLEGQTLAYLIDFLGTDGKTVEFRIHYQDAASERMLGFPPPLDTLDNARPIDLALVCMPGFNEVDNYPEAFIGKYQPRFVVLIHWEDFFQVLPEDPADLRTVAHEPAKRFLARLEKVLQSRNYTLPAPGHWMQFVP